MEVHVTRRYRFPASHRLNSPLLSDEENCRIYGKCNNPYGHGHDYLLEVTFRGPVAPASGRLLPLHLVDSLVRKVVLEDMAWRNLNVEVEEFAGLVPTTENLALVIARRLERSWPLYFRDQPARFERVRIYETKNNIFEAFAGQTATPSEAPIHEHRKHISK